MSASRRSITLFMLGALLVLAACTQTSQQAAPPQAAAPAAPSYAGTAPGVTPAGFRLPEGGGCQGDIARWAAIQDNDLKTGHVAQSVYDNIQRDIAAARAACSAGNSAQASSMIRASRARNGYPAG
ncbi:MAG: hypothetical protein FJX29_02245 [Alphaproteobacteria bacterium]|nr:hypothetical protein [Alphaproteobacteria bacterium]